jgi:hypothetical protein
MACSTPGFLPKIDICINNKCDSICIKELTDIIQAPYNLTGWGASNILTSDVVTATITILNLDGDTVKTFVVKDEVDIDLYPNTTPTPFVITDDESWSSSDGIYQVVYIITADSNTYTNGGQYTLFTCSIKNCINTLVASIVKECNKIKLSEQKELLDQLELIVYGIESAFSCNDFTTATQLIEAAQKICDNICDCGCNDC